MNDRILAAYILRELGIAHAHAGRANHERLSETIGVRAQDVRRVVSKLHAQGYVDALRMRLRPEGFVLARAFMRVPLRPLREVLFENVRAA